MLGKADKKSQTSAGTKEAPEDQFSGVEEFLAL